MKKYIVQWGNKEKEFTEFRQAIEFAEKTAETRVSTYVWVETGGVRDSEPFFECSWSI